METRIHLCGRVVFRISGERVENAVPGRLGRLLLAYLVLERRRESTRSEIVEALWPDGGPAAAESSLAALLSKLRRTLGHDRIVGRGSVRLVLPAGAWIDVEAAEEALHRAEAALAAGDAPGAWGPGRVTLHVAARPFLHGEDAPWVQERRARVRDLYERALQVVGDASLRIGGAELATAERCARAAVREAPYRESGWRLLMEVLAATGNGAEALLAYDDLRRRLRDDLGVAPGPDLQALHRSLLGTDG